MTRFALKPIAVIAFVLAPFFALADHSEPHTIQQLQARVNELRAQIDQLLKRQPAPDPLSPFGRDLSEGLRNDNDVKALQEFLEVEGHYAGPVTGNFFSLTREAVRKFQRANGVDATGYFGPRSRQAANQRFRSQIATPLGEVFREQARRSPLERPRPAAPTLPPLLSGTVLKREASAFTLKARLYDPVTQTFVNQEYRIPLAAGDAVEILDKGAATPRTATLDDLKAQAEVRVLTVGGKKTITILAK